MKKLIIIILILTSSCKSFEVTSNKYSHVYQFKNSKTILFNDSIMRNQFEVNPITIKAKDIIKLNKKLDNEFFNYIKKTYTGFNYDSVPDSEYYIEQENVTLDWAKGVQNQMNHLNKQIISFRDSLGRRIITVKVIQSEELQVEIEKKWVGNMYTLKYNIENSTFIEE